ncbi:hypothetical protein B0H14DRAFT_2351158 [Mycena olivaceomarginata]|nr:hypothetical protein B0H14DRAFT_2351158 [Mycena olivaceomarginata]
MSQNRSPSVYPLHKGQACVNCRSPVLFQKCDGTRPMCGQCSRYSVAFGDCEYTDNGQSSAQMLEEQISILQARIEGLEKPKDKPQVSGSRGYSVAPSQMSPSTAMGLGPLLTHFFHNFLHNATSFGFFLDTQAFHDAVTSSNGRTLPPVLLNVMYLWGVHLSNDARITVYEPAFLHNALRSTAGSLVGTHPRTLLHSAQTSVLLAHYFLRNGRALEGRYHTSAAVATVLSAGLNLIRGRSRPPSAEALPPTGDALEEGERIACFWAVLTLNNCWASVDGGTYSPEGLEIDTPWPLEPRDYRPHMLPRHSSGTVARFLADNSEDATSNAALYAKVGILFEAATRLGARYHGISRSDSELGALDRRIDVFAAALPPVQSKILLIVHTLAHGATIRLHEPLANNHSFARTKALSAACAISNILLKTDVPKVGVIDPVISVSLYHWLLPTRQTNPPLFSASLDIELSRAYRRNCAPARTGRTHTEPY